MFTLFAQDSIPHLLPKSKAVFQLLAALLHLSCLGECATPLRNSSHILTSSHPHIFTSSGPHILTSSHPRVLTSSHLHILGSSHPHILASSHPHILASSHPHILMSLHADSITISEKSYKGFSHNGHARNKSRLKDLGRLSLKA